MSLEIVKIPSDKDGVFRRASQLNGMIPKHHNVSCIVGSQGSGKSNFIVNLFKNPLMYGKSHETEFVEKDPRPYFDLVFWFTGSGDDLVDGLVKDGIIKESHVVEDPTIDDLQRVIDHQKNLIERIGIKKSPRLCFVFDDLGADTKLMRSTAFKACFTKQRHFNCTTFILAQRLKQIDPTVRAQANFVFCFAPQRADVEILFEQFCPPHLNKEKFYQLISQACEEKYSFLTYSKNSAPANQFRKNLDTFLVTEGCGHPEPVEWVFQKPLTRKGDDRVNLEQDNKEAQEWYAQLAKKTEPHIKSLMSHRLGTTKPVEEVQRKPKLNMSEQGINKPFWG